MSPADITTSTHSFGVAVVGVEKNPVSSQKFLECVANGISQFPNADRVHHAGVSQLTHAQLSVKHLEGVPARIRTLSILT